MVRAFSAFRGPPRQSPGPAAGLRIPPAWSALRPISNGFDAISVGLNDEARGERPEKSDEGLERVEKAKEEQRRPGKCR